MIYLVVVVVTLVGWFVTCAKLAPGLAREAMARELTERERKNDKYNDAELCKSLDSIDEKFAVSMARYTYNKAMFLGPIMYVTNAIRKKNDAIFEREVIEKNPKALQKRIEQLENELGMKE